VCVKYYIVVTWINTSMIKKDILRNFSRRRRLALVIDVDRVYVVRMSRRVLERHIR
jgi:hypothetical protein